MSALGQVANGEFKAGPLRWAVRLFHDTDDAGAQSHVVRSPPPLPCNSRTDDRNVNFTPVPPDLCPASKSLPDTTVFFSPLTPLLHPILSSDFLILHPLYSFATSDFHRSSVHVGKDQSQCLSDSSRFHLIVSCPHSRCHPPVSTIPLSKARGDGDEQLRRRATSSPFCCKQFRLPCRRIPEIPQTLILSAPLSY